jgi:WD40 repeat protein
VQRDSTIAQIQNFGQTPSRLANKPFPQKAVFHALRDKSIDFSALTYLASLTPPFCVVGAPHRVYVRPTATDTCRLGIIGQSDSSVGDLCLLKGQLIGVGRNCTLIVSSKKYCRFGGPNNGVSVHNAAVTARNRETNKILTVHDGMHRAAITTARASLNGRWLVTGCADSTVRVWRYENNFMSLQATLCGHEGGQLTCIDISTVFGSIVTGCGRGSVVLWDLRTLTFVRRLRHPFLDDSHRRTASVGFCSAISVSINNRNGSVVTLVGSNLSIFDINGTLIATYDHGATSGPTCAVSTDCPEWMEQGIVAVTGHENGEVRFWGIDYENQELIMRHTLAENPHNCAITALRVTGVDRQDTLLVGDKSGSVSVCKTLQLENLSQQELMTVVAELRGASKFLDTFPVRGRTTSTG